MAVLSFESGMNSAENDQTNDSSHENNLYADRQLQNKLLQLEEDSDMEAYDQKLSKSWNILKSKTGRSDPRTDITGWFPSAKFVGRRHELQRPETKPTFIHPWKDYRSTKKDDQSYVFKHYTEYRKYIEQYRIEHGCNANRFPSGNQIGDMRRIAFQGSVPPQNSPITVQQMQQSGYSTISPQTMHNQSTLQYANRKEQLGTLVTGTTNGSASNKSNYIEPSSHAQKYRVNNGKLPRNNTLFDLRNDSDNSSDCGDARLRSPSRRSNSASSQRTKSRNLTKSPTKITVPASSNTRSYPLQALTIAWRLQRALKARYRQRQQNGKPDICPSPKPLDNLNCVAPEKQMWFDASGRAYVSLASRYDPVKKY